MEEYDVLSVADHVVESLMATFSADTSWIKRQGRSRCAAITPTGQCVKIGGYTQVSGHDMDPEYCISHNLIPWRDPLGRYRAIL